MKKSRRDNSTKQNNMTYKKGKNKETKIQSTAVYLTLKLLQIFQSITQKSYVELKSSSFTREYKIIPQQENGRVNLEACYHVRFYYNI